jgi:hypothetical protein
MLIENWISHIFKHLRLAAAITRFRAFLWYDNGLCRFSILQLLASRGWQHRWRTVHSGAGTDVMILNTVGGKRWR